MTRNSTVSRQFRFGRLLLLSLAAGFALVAAAPAPVSAHPIHPVCPQNHPYETWQEAYVNQLDPEDPDTWTSGVGCVSTLSD